MRNAWLLRLLVGAVLVLLLGWIVRKTTWEEIEVDDPVKGAAATDPVYTLRAILAAGGATLETRHTLDALPPADATLVLDSTFWNLFPDRDARLRAWVEAGGHLVLDERQLDDDNRPRWVPQQLPAARGARHPAGASAPASGASAASDSDDDDDDEQPVASRPPVRAGQVAARKAPDTATRECRREYVETPQSVPAFEPGRRLHSCFWGDVMRVPSSVRPSWQLVDGPRTLALRVPFGRGHITSIAPWWMAFGNRVLLNDDNALIVAAILDIHPGRTVWIVDDEAGEPLSRWLWHHARAPLLLALAAIALGLWRLMLRFGPREAAAATGRRSMGEQVRGTGEFIAATDPAALHSATRRAFDDAARTRVQAWADLDDPERVDALAAALPPTLAIDRATLLAALDAAPRTTQAQWLSAIATLEQARRALLRANAAPPA